MGVLYSEMGRLLSHLLNVTTQALDVGALTVAAGLRGARKINDVLRARVGSADACQLFSAVVHQDSPETSR